ncbi:MAG: PPOX class F420-dependent oxidoreductase, partial [Egibacteraceae bacterium]
GYATYMSRIQHTTRLEGMSELSPEVRELLDARNVAHLATLMPDGAPQVSPVWIAVEDDRLAIFSAQENLKLKNLRRDGRVALSVCDERNPYRSAIIRGRVVEELEGREAIAIMDRMSNRYVGQDFPMRRAIVSFIEPERVRFQNLPFDHLSAAD